MKRPRQISGIGIKYGTNPTITLTTSSSAKIFPNNRKLNDNGFLKSSRIFNGNKAGIG